MQILFGIVGTNADKASGRWAVKPAPGAVMPPPVSGSIVAAATGDKLTMAIVNALPGDVIKLADGTYTSKLEPDDAEIQQALYSYVRITKIYVWRQS